LGDNSLAAILDFYSDRAVAHASFFLASFFGLFTVLSIGEKEIFEWAFPYWILFSVGLYTLIRFAYYATFAHLIMVRMRESDYRSGVVIQEAEGRISPCLRKTQRLRERLSRRSSMWIIGGVLYFALSLISFFLKFCPPIGRSLVVIALTITGIIAIPAVIVLVILESNCR